jgi:uncharacterized protein (TIGR02145 family)
MEKAKYLPSLIILILIILSCDNRSGKSSVTGLSGSGQSEKSKSGNTDSSGSESINQIPQTIEDIEGNIYNTVTIGNQTWMAKNLKTTRYNDGIAIPLITDSTSWSSLTTPAYCWYNNEASSFKPSYGALYNGYAVSTGKLCPAGWHVPGDSEWTALTSYLGGEAVAGGKLKENGMDFWVSPNTGADNTSRFTAIPGGFRYHDGIFHDFGFSGYWWSSTEYSETRAYFRYLDYEYSNAFRFNNLKRNGFSIRCIKD